MSEKIQPQHLARKAMLYVRQSSAFQVAHNQESGKLQYAMQARLRDLGFSEIEISVHGVVRASLDADAVLSITPSKLKKLEQAFKRNGFETELRRGDQDDPIPALLALSDTHGNRVDLLGGLRGLEPAAFSRTIQVPFLGETLRVIGREDFIAMKFFAGSPQDIADAQRVLNVARETLDTDLLRRLARRYGRAAADALEKVLAT